MGYNGLNPTCCERSLDGYGSRCKDGDRRSHARRPRVHFPTSGPSPSYRQQVMDDWRRDLSSLDRSSPAWRSCEPPDGSSPLPFIRGVLSSRSRRLFSAAIQLPTRHSFDANYSAKFRPTADDNTTCPCSHEEGPGGLRRPSKSYNINYILFRCPLPSQRQAISAPPPPLHSSSVPKMEGGNYASSSTPPKHFYAPAPDRTPLKDQRLRVCVTSIYVHLFHLSPLLDNQGYLTIFTFRMMYFILQCLVAQTVDKL